MGDRALIRSVKDVEDVASGLHRFRDALPRSATRITATIRELFALSTVLREIVDNPRYSPTFNRVQDDLDLVLPSLQHTLGNAFDMFGSREAQYQVAWDDLGRRMDREEGAGLLERLKWYHDFLRAQADILDGYQPTDLRTLRRQIIALLDAQEVSALRAQRRSIDTSGRCAPCGLNTNIVRSEVD